MENPMNGQNSSLHIIADADGAAILDVERGLISTLNATGSFIWQSLKRGESPSEIAASLAKQTGEDPLVVERDVEAFIDDLKHRNLMPQ